MRVGDFLIDRTDERVIGPAGPLKLGNKAYRVFLLLAEQDGRLLTKDALFSSVWDGTCVSESALTSVIKELRRALGDETKTPRYIESVYGRGYRLLAAVEAKAAMPAPEPPPAETAPPIANGAGGPPLLTVREFDDAAIRQAHPHVGAVAREEVLLALSRFRDISLVSDLAAAPARGNHYGERDYALTVRLAPAAGGTKAYVRLGRLASQSVVWADTVSLAEETLGADIDELVRRIAAAALPSLRDDLLAHLPAQPHDVYDRHLLLKLKMRGTASFAQAQGIAADWEELIADHPGFAAAYPPLTRLYNTDFCYSGLGATGERERRRAYELAHRALAIHPTEAHLHTVKGWSHLWAGEAALARGHLEEALHLNPYNQGRLTEVATAMMYLDQIDVAAELLDRCASLAPLAMDAPHEDLGLLHLLRGEFDLAIEQLTLARRIHTDDPDGYDLPIMSELFALLAAAGADAPDVGARARHWRARMRENWCAAEPPDDARLRQWALFHSPFQNAGRLSWFAALVEKALAASDEGPGRTPGPDRPRKGSRPSPGGAPHPA